MGKHSIIIIKNKDNKYLQYYDNIWNSYLFLNCKLPNGNNTDLVKNEVSKDLGLEIDDINVKLLDSKTHKKFSESAKKEKEYTHYFYKVTLNKEIKNDDFEINDVKYKWLSYEEMINDERISKVNSDIIEFVRNIEESNERKTIMKNREVKPFSIWKHFKGTTAFVITVAKHSETNEKLVVYYCTGNEGKTNHKDGIYARPLDMFLSEVDHEKYPNVNQKYRFEEIDSENN